MDQQLWNKISAFDFDDPIAEYGFSTRLAFENNWTLNFTKDAIVEYKKFMYLAATADVMVSPSPIVDIVWHQHLIFTDSYDIFCKMIGKKISHIPSTHNPDQRDLFEKARISTEKLYNIAFGNQPKSIWKYKTMRESLEFNQIGNKQKKVLIYGLVLSILIVYPLSLLLMPVYSTIDSSNFLFGFVLLFGMTILALRWHNKDFSETVITSIVDKSVIANLEPAELTFMKTGNIKNVVHDAVNRLIKKNVLVILPHDKIGIQNHSTPVNAFDKAILDTVSDVKTIFYHNLLERLVRKEIFCQIRNTALSINTHFIQSKAYLRLLLVNYATLLFVLILGVSRLFSGIIREKPSGYLVVLLIIVTILIINQLRTLNYFLLHTISQYYKGKVTNDPKHAGDWQYFLYGDVIFTTAFVSLIGNRRSIGDWIISGDSSWGSGDGGSCGSSCSSGCGGCGGD